MSSSSWVNAAGGLSAAGAAKLRVHVAENGRSFAVDCDSSTPVGTVQSIVYERTGVPVNDQLLLCGITALAGAEKPLSFYQLPCDGLEVFLYNKARLHDNARPPEPEVVDIPEPELVPQPDRCLRNVTMDPALNALISYEHQFRYHCKFSEVLYHHSKKKFDASRRLIQEWLVQERAVETARTNIEHTFQKFLHRYSNFIRCFNQQHRGHGELLANFERDVERLKKLVLHPALHAGSRRCLIDLVKEQDLRELAVACMASHQQFEAKVSQWKLNFTDLRHKVESVLAMMSSATGRDIELVIKEHQKVIEEQESIMLTLSKNVHNAKKLVDDCSSPQASAFLRAHDAVSAVGPTYEIHESSYLPRMRDTNQLFAKLLSNCLERKNEMNLLVHVSMKEVRSVQNDIKRMTSELHAFQEVMAHQEKDFDNLKLVSGIGYAYKACLSEIVRRRSSNKLYMGLAGQLVEKLATEREAEIGKREDFFRTWSRYIPREILGSMGLFDTPSQCDVNIGSFDGDLLQIDMDDIDRLVPPSLVGNSPVALHKASSAIFSTSGKIKSEEISIHAGDKMDFQDIPEASDSIDIAGTSKMEVQNARLKAELASAIAIICGLNAKIVYDYSEEGGNDDAVKNVHEKTSEALDLKDDYANRLQLMLDDKNRQCSSYEKRIQELEQRLSEMYIKPHKGAMQKDISGSNNYNVELGDGQDQLQNYSSITMEDASSSNTMDQMVEKLISNPLKQLEGGDDNMADLMGLMKLPSVDWLHNAVDSPMFEATRIDGEKVGDAPEGGKEMNVTVNNPANLPVSLEHHKNENLAVDLSNKESLIIDLQNAVKDYSKKLAESESKLRIVMEEVANLRSELEGSRALLDESQMNCAHLENCLHEAREEARTNKCSADRRADEYEVLRSSAVKTRALFERLRSCVNAPNMHGFVESLRSLAISLASSAKKDEGDATADFQHCINALADKVGSLIRQSTELSARNTRLAKDLDEKQEAIRNMYVKHQQDKQVSKEKISFGRLEVHEIAAFVRNKAGHYEAINRNSSNYYLSDESIALFTESPSYIVGQVVHIERRTVRPSALIQHADLGDLTELAGPDSGGRRTPGFLGNEYDLPVGCEYFVVTVAMLPDSAH